MKLSHRQRRELEANFADSLPIQPSLLRDWLRCAKFREALLAQWSASPAFRTKRGNFSPSPTFYFDLGMKHWTRDSHACSRRRIRWAK